MTAPRKPRPRVGPTEAQFQRTVLAFAKLHGWRCAHFRKAQNARGAWRTPVAADGAGFPDLVMVHPTRGVMFVELKAENGMASTDQLRWVAALTRSGAEACVVKPSGWDALAERLSGRARCPVTT